MGRIRCATLAGRCAQKPGCTTTMQQCVGGVSVSCYVYTSDLRGLQAGGLKILFGIRSGARCGRVAVGMSFLCSHPERSRGISGTSGTMLPETSAPDSAPSADIPTTVGNRFSGYVPASDTFTAWLASLQTLFSEHPARGVRCFPLLPNIDL